MIENRDLKYEQELTAYLQSRLPDKIYDAHFHISRRYNAKFENVGTPFEQFFNFTEKYLGKGRLQGGFMMAQPSKTEFLDDDNLYNLELAAKEKMEAGLLVSPECGREKTERLLNKYPQISALKPYLCYSVKAERYESDILDFAPEWMWELANDRKMPVMLHLSHYQNMLSEPANVEQIQYLCRKYPKMKMILAHCAMGHHVRKMRLGLEQIKGLENIWFDCSGATEALSIYYCIKTFGVERMMYGGDYNHAETMGRIFSFGSNFIGLHPGYLDPNALPGDYKYQPICNQLEGLLALFDAADLLELTDSDMEKIFYDNAVALFRK